MKEFIGRAVQITTPDGRRYSGKLAAHYEDPVIVLQVGGIPGDHLVLPADSKIEELEPPEWKICEHCKGKGRWNEGGYDYSNPHGFAFANYIGT